MAKIIYKTFYAWIITKDFNPDHSYPEGSYYNAKGLTGPRFAPNSLIEKLREGQGEKFRMLDDDRELVYEGRIIGRDAEEPLDFQPLDDFGEANAGCTIIQYWMNSQWEDL